MQLLSEPDWQARAAAHAERVEPWISPRLARREHGERHPVDDFLFDYYAWRPGQLARWHPGAGTCLTGDVRSFATLRGYSVEPDRAYVDPSQIPYAQIRATLALLEATASRAPAFSCFGRHEWAMVYRAEASAIRHSSWPLRVDPATIDEVIESTPLRCTHFDAFRFYTEPARPLNVLQPSRATQVELEQPGCLHAAMDLYKWCFRSYPAIGADLTADCFELAREVRSVDMRASPYDFTGLGYEPIAIETGQGRSEYVEYQRDFAMRSARLRARLIAALQSALAPAGVP